jgi:hypothetical protein
MVVSESMLPRHCTIPHACTILHDCPFSDTKPCLSTVLELGERYLLRGVAFAAYKGSPIKWPAPREDRFLAP